MTLRAGRLPTICTFALTELVTTAPQHAPPTAASRIAPLLRLSVHRIGSWRNVLIQMEDIVWVIFSLQLRQPCVGLLAIGCPDPVLPLAAEKVHIDAASREGLHRCPEVARPGDLRLRFRWVGPHRVNVDHERRLTMAVGACISIHPGDRPLELREKRLAVGRWRLLRKRDN